MPNCAAVHCTLHYDCYVARHDGPCTHEAVPGSRYCRDHRWRNRWTLAVRALCLLAIAVIVVALVIEVTR